MLKRFSEVRDQLGRPAGWQRGEGDVVFRDPRFGTIVHAAVCNQAGEPLYDLPVWNETPGAVVTVPVTNDGRVLLVDMERPVPRRIEHAHARDPLALEHHGVRGLEVPRGFGEAGESAWQTASRELMEETGYELASLEPIGWIHVSLTFYATPLPVYLATLGARRESPSGDGHERIHGIEALALPAVFGAIREGRLTCSVSKAAILQWIAHQSEALERG